MRLESLAQLDDKEPEVFSLDTLPEKINITDYAMQKAFAVNRIIRIKYQRSFEWYGFLIADINNPTLVTDVGFGYNSRNDHAYTKIEPAEIAAFQETLPEDKAIVGWIHSHADLGLRAFSGTDERNHKSVLSYVTSLVMNPIEKKEIMIDDLDLLVQGYDKKELVDGTVTLVTDTPVKSAKLYETIFGGFSYAIVIGDEGWKVGDIHHKEKGLLTGDHDTRQLSQEGLVEIVEVDTGKSLTSDCVRQLIADVKEKIKSPIQNYSLNRFVYQNRPTYSQPLNVRTSGPVEAVTNFAKKLYSRFN